MKAFLLITFLYCSISFCFAQGTRQKGHGKEDTATLHMRDVVVTMDTTVEYNNLAKGSNIVDFLQIDKGLRLTIIDNSFKIFYFDGYAGNNLNGVHMEFYLPSNMPKEKGSYLNNEKDGEWFYWSEKGILLKKELWKKGKLIKKT